MLQIAQRFLQWTGLPKAVHAENGREALRIFETQGPFDLILMDCQMPVVDGYEGTSWNLILASCHWLDACSHDTNT